jgi:hypothetical protein
LQDDLQVLKGRLHETVKIGLIFVVPLILPGRLSNFCKHPTDRHHIAQNQTERYQNSYIKISQRAWQNWTDSLAKSVRRDKNWKRHCSCKWGFNSTAMTCKTTLTPTS